MAVTGTTVAAAATMLAVIAAIFLSFVLWYYICLRAKRSKGGAPPLPPGSGVMARLRFLFCGGDGRVDGEGDAAAVWCYVDGGVEDASMASLPCREVANGEAMHCAVYITELAAGETARVLPLCGHEFHVDCADTPSLAPVPVQALEGETCHQGSDSGKTP